MKKFHSCTIDVFRLQKPEASPPLLSSDPHNIVSLGFAASHSTLVVWLDCLAFSFYLMAFGFVINSSFLSLFMQSSFILVLLSSLISQETCHVWVKAKEL